MLRRQARLRREYLYRKNLESQEHSILERKRKFKRALEDGTSIPTEMRGDEGRLVSKMELDDPDTQLETTHEDDEYAYAGVEDPKLVVTTSHSPSSRLKQFAKELKLIFPNAQRLNRGNAVLTQLVEACKSNGVTDLIIAHEHRGVPDGIVVSHFPYGPTAYFTLSGTVLRHDIPDVGKISEQYPHLIFNNLTSKLGKRVTNILKYLFPVPKPDAKRIMTFANDKDFISFRHHMYKRKFKSREIELEEVGPRFELRPYLIRLGTVNETEADVEWRLRPYMNTARKRQALAPLEIPTDI
ncbi:U3 small nucleolar ribonucleoprotein IMP4 [Oopsacas minuta]|uniref:U3 small nucleolar ribonucleoprotein IMP4 n=1 Tax=Oopsacas minuta TaxID=111878 RepID=A0AAV7K700_9METZ|nr:U3 small nucleolar ribonucleoprotein IMP4 [Oopsacas minuta]